MRLRIGFFLVLMLLLAFTTTSYAYKMNPNKWGNSWKNAYFENDHLQSLLDDCDLSKAGKDWKSWKDKDIDLKCLPDDWFDDLKTLKGMKDSKYKDGNWQGGNSAAPIPTTFWLFGSGLAGLVGLRRNFRK